MYAYSLDCMSKYELHNETVTVCRINVGVLDSITDYVCVQSLL